jgi:hypothetical protein
MLVAYAMDSWIILHDPITRNHNVTAKCVKPSRDRRVPARRELLYAAGSSGFAFVLNGEDRDVVGLCGSLGKNPHTLANRFR